MTVKLQMILSPAKTMNFAPSATADAAGATEAAGAARVDELAALLKKKSQAQLKALLGVSDSIAAENHARFQNWDGAEPRQAIVAYDGMAYDKLDGRTLTEAQMGVAQRRLLILSGMWGPVRALDRIKPYRLEMACKALPEPYTKLAEYWRGLSTETLQSGFSEGAGRVLVDVASGEYAAAIDFDAVRASGVRVLKVDFMQGGRRAPTVHLKHGRGLVCRYIIQNDVDDVEALKGFDLEGYSFSDMSDDVITFARDAAPPKKPAKKKQKKA